jgi:hypothetical protein
MSFLRWDYVYDDDKLLMISDDVNMIMYMFEWRIYVYVYMTW